ncbi:heparan sulfate glucosamine 3-O-sulfotransferase 5-like [Dreissena polymorpha]|uniref:Sulfotransferase domain-containing protein n=1 Tax=Dreissena polymorpha TaxID=45954 RepID=A0A9D4KXB0_DREPO|nr:heparan sulfate glucosamine 3-O-sulfotransferase 5-like [Dreissena polymorpha]XP_052273532.1 heparan sulfate glucosamine 3-O-sulfotransferase 5-like [Dreissena polymorpha]KAH3847600.1 hypothetical protein DPMN_089927 [Dreissena polymorpha]
MLMEFTSFTVQQWQRVIFKMGFPRKRQAWVVISSLAVFFCVTLVFNNQVRKVLNSSMLLDNMDLSEGYGLRKLLEDQEAKIERLRSEGMEQRLPQCIIIGVRKCGTRALLEFLDLHPQIRIADMEMHFFNNDENYEKGYDWYRKYMPFSFPSDITIEKTPRYFISESAAERIRKFNSSAKLIVIFRNPTTRVISDYTQVYQNKLERNKSIDRFEDLVISERTGRVNTGYKAVRISMYYYHMTKWLHFFERDQIHVVNGDNLIDNPLEEIRKVETFLGLQNLVTESNVYFNETRGFFCMQSDDKQQHCLGAKKGRKHPAIDPIIVKKMNNFYRPYNKKLFQMIGQKFDWD